MPVQNGKAGAVRVMQVEECQENERIEEFMPMVFPETKIISSVSISVSRQVAIPASSRFFASEHSVCPRPCGRGRRLLAEEERPACTFISPSGCRIGSIVQAGTRACAVCTGRYKQAPTEATLPFQPVEAGKLPSSTLPAE